MKCKYILLAMLTFSLLASCDATTKIKMSKTKPSVVPIPKEFLVKEGVLELSEKSEIYVSDSSLIPLAELFVNDVDRLTDYRFSIANEANRFSVIVFELNENLAVDEYKIEIDESILMTAGSYQSAAMAKSTLLQLLKNQDNAERPMFHRGIIKDRSDASYRGAMLDLARNPHSLETVKKIIDLAAFYKINYLQLHFTDDQSYTLPSVYYPKLTTESWHYSFEQLEELEVYSQERGVTIIPEIDVPGHATSIVNAYPEIFGIAAMNENPKIINMGNEEVYKAMDLLIGELAAIFRTSPYFHIGGDEAVFNKVLEDPDVIAYMQHHGLGDDVHELYRHFLVKMNEIVKKHGKTTCLWEGFAREGTIEIPKDVIVFEFETNRYLPNELVADGYNVVNASWVPLYVVNEKKWSPETIYNWNMWLWKNWWDMAPSFKPIQVKKSPLVIGAQMCAWEQAEEVEFKSFRKRLPVMAERIWNTEKKIEFDSFLVHLEHTDAILSKLVNSSEQDSLWLGYDFVADKN